MGAACKHSFALSVLPFLAALRYAFLSRVLILWLTIMMMKDGPVWSIAIRKVIANSINRFIIFRYLTIRFNDTFVAWLIHFTRAKPTASPLNHTAHAKHHRPRQIASSPAFATTSSLSCRLNTLFTHESSLARHNAFHNRVHRRGAD